MNKAESNAKRRKQYKILNPDRYRGYDKKYYASHREERLSKQKEYAEKNKESIKIYRRSRNTNIPKNYYRRLIQKLRIRIQSAFKHGKGIKMVKTEELLGCKFTFAKQYLESLFKEGMHWGNNTTKGWHIDHIIPIESFDMNKIEDQKKCFHYTNLQPLWWYENIIKGCKQ